MMNKSLNNSALKVFIADDSPLVRECLGDLITELDHIELVGHAGEIYEVLEGIQQSKPHVVILDIHTSEVAGIRVLEMIKASEEAPVVIMLDAFPYPYYRQKCLAAGADYFFDKIIEFESTIDVLKELRLNSSTENELSA